MKERETSIKIKVLHQKIKTLKPLDAFFDNRAFRGTLWNEKRSPKMHCILEKCHTKNVGLKWYDKPYSGVTDGHCGLYR